MQEFLTRKQVSERYPISEHTLARLASQGRGPVFYKPIDVALYRAEDIDAWIAAAIVTPKPKGERTAAPEGRGRRASSTRSNRTGAQAVVSSSSGRPRKSLTPSVDSVLRRPLGVHANAVLLDAGIDDGGGQNP